MRAFFPIFKKEPPVYYFQVEVLGQQMADLTNSED